MSCNEVEVVTQTVHITVSESNGIVTIVNPPVVEFSINEEVVNIVIQEIENSLEIVEEKYTVTVAVVGAQGPKGDSGGAWTKHTSLVPANDSAVVDSNVLASFTSLDYVFNIFNTSEDLNRKLRMTAEKDGVTIDTVVYARSGLLKNVAIDANVNGLSGEIIITNNNNFSLEVSYARLIL